MLKKIKSHFLINSDKYTLCLVLFTLGIFVGFGIIFLMHTEQLTELKNYINSYLCSFTFEKSGLKNIFAESLQNDLAIFFIIWLFSFRKIGKYVGFFIIFVKGFFFGFTSCVFIEQYLIKGLLFNMYVLFPPLLFEILSISFLCACVCAFSNQDFKKNQNIRAMGAFTILMFISILIYSVGIAYESFVSPHLIVNIAKNMI